MGRRCWTCGAATETGDLELGVELFSLHPATSGLGLQIKELISITYCYSA
jgi:hypothetical protein